MQEWEVQQHMREGNAIVKFTATWCGPCQQIEGELNECAEDLRLKVVHADVDVCDTLASLHRVRTIPCFLVCSGGSTSRLLHSLDEVRQHCRSMYADSLPCITVEDLPLS